MVVLVAIPAEAQAEIKLTASDGAAGENFGVSGSLSGDTVLVGAPNHDDPVTNSGSVYVFEGVFDPLAASCVTPPPGLVSWWPGDGNANDIAGANHGTTKNGATFGTGLVRQAFRFDGVDDWVSAPGTGVDGLQELTIDAWVRLDSLPAEKTSRFVTLTGEKAVLRYDGENGPQQLHFYMKIDGTLHHIRVNNVLQIGIFHHVAGTYDGSVMRAYLDGAEVGSLAISGTVDAGFGVELGSHFEPMEGLLDEVEIHNRAASATEIGDISNAGSGGKCRPDSGLSPQGLDPTVFAGILVAVGVAVVVGGTVAVVRSRRKRMTRPRSPPPSSPP